CFIALAGGDTPRSVYRLLAAEPLVHQVRWSLVHLFFGDERIVPPDDPQSNFGMVARELLKHLVIPEGNIHRIHGELPAAEAASEYAIELRAIFNSEIPRFDLMLLGAGEDGHTASLFPGTEAVAED